MALTANAQSFDIMASPQNTKAIAEFFSAGDNYNAYSYNEWQSQVYKSTADMPGMDSLGGQTMNMLSLNYVEYCLFDNFYVHPEVRLNSHWGNSYYLGVAYRLPINAVDVYVVPMYRRNGDKGGANEFQLSINTSADWEHFYYQGYLDMYTNQKHWGYDDNVSIFTEQRFYWKAYEGLQIGINLTATTNPLLMPKGTGYVNPYLAIRYAF